MKKADSKNHGKKKKRENLEIPMYSTWQQYIKTKKKFSITKQIRASTSMDAKLCKMQKIFHFTHFDPKNTNISEYKNVYKCSIAIVTVYMHGYCSTCIYYFIIFFSLSLSCLWFLSVFLIFFSLLSLLLFPSLFFFWLQPLPSSSLASSASAKQSSSPAPLESR